MSKLVSFFLFVIVTACNNISAVGQTVNVDEVNYVLKKDNKAAVAKGAYVGNILIHETINHEGQLYVVDEVGNSAFAYNEKLLSVLLPGTIEIIRGRAFEGCEELQRVTIPRSVTKIEQSVFSKCKNLKTIEIPENVSEIGDYAFSYCESLSEIVVAKSNRYFAAIDGALYNKEISELIRCPETTVMYEFPATIKSFKAEAFENCSKLTNILLPISVSKIPMNAFNGCSSIEEFSIHEGVDFIGLFAFTQCSSLTVINVHKQNNYFSSVNGVLYDKKQTTLITCPPKKAGIIIPQSVKKIESRAFFGCSLIIDIVLPEEVASIGFGAFRNCSSLQTLKIQSLNQPSLGDGAFGGLPKNFVILVPNDTLVEYTQSNKLDWKEMRYKGY